MPENDPNISTSNNGCSLEVFKKFKSTDRSKSIEKILELCLICPVDKCEVISNMRLGLKDLDSLRALSISHLINEGDTCKQGRIV